MDLRDRFHHAAAWLEASPAEMAGLLSLLLGGVALTLYVVLVPRGLGLDVGRDAGAAPPSEPVVGVPSLAGEVTVHVVGAVARPGLVVVPAGSRVADAIESAGGATADAELGALNLARPVTDGEQVVVPRIGDAPPAGSDGGTGDGAWRADGRLDLNAATASEFEELPGVGPVLAGRIVDWREQHGPFVEVGQLREVAGIGEKTFQSLSELVTV
jgi:competence protein ComEA